MVAALTTPPHVYIDVRQQAQPSETKLSDSNDQPVFPNDQVLMAESEV